MLNNLPTTIINFSLITLSIIIGLTCIYIFNHKKFKSRLLCDLNDLSQKISSFLLLGNERNRAAEDLREQITRFLLEHKDSQAKQRAQFDEHQIKNLKLLTESLQLGMHGVREQIVTLLQTKTDDIGKSVDKLTQETKQQLKEISGQVEKRLSEGFEKTTATFTDVVKRLALIDEAQKRITELSSNVVSLQEILTDKQARGAFGEIQLENLIRNVLPAEHFSFQHSLANHNRVDCMLFLPQPTGSIAIDAKFPLESYQRLSDQTTSEAERHQARQQLRQDIRTHLQDIATKYIVPDETADFALMFIPAEAIFAEVHSHYPDLVELSHRSRVFMVSPSTMMALVTTAGAILKDAATRKQIHIIQKHLGALSKDFERFQKRMDNLAKHVGQAHVDVQEVQQSSQKISSHFNKIENVELDGLEGLGKLGWTSEKALEETMQSTRTDAS